MHRGVLLPSRLWRCYWQRHLLCRVLLSRGRHYGHGRRDRRNVRCGNLLPRRRGFECGQWRVRRWIILPRRCDDRRRGWDGRRVRCELLLPGKLRLLQRRRRRRYMRLVSEDVQRGLLLPRWRNDSSRRRDGRRVYRRVLLPCRIDNDSGQRPVHRGVLLRVGQRDAGHVWCGKLLPSGRRGGDAVPCWQLWHLDYRVLVCMRGPV